jgi:hypothetical protein
MKNKGLDLPLTALWGQKAADWLPAVRTWIEGYGAWIGLAVLLSIALWSYCASRRTTGVHYSLAKDSQ